MKKLIFIPVLFLFLQVSGQTDIQKTVIRNNRISAGLYLAGATTITYAFTKKYPYQFDSHNPEQGLNEKRAYVASGLVMIITGAALRHQTKMSQRLDYSLSHKGFYIGIRF